MIYLALGLLTNLEKDRIQNYINLKKEIKWRTSSIIDKKTKNIVDDLIFLLENRKSIGTIEEIIGKEKMEKLLTLIISDMGVEQSILTPELVVSIIEENRVLANIIAKKNKVWRDLMGKINSAKNIEDFIKQITSRENVYLVDGENVRVHIRK